MLPKQSFYSNIIVALISAAAGYFASQAQVSIETAKLDNEQLIRKQDHFLSRCDEIKNLHGAMNSNLQAVYITANSQLEINKYLAKLRASEQLAYTYFGSSANETLARVKKQIQEDEITTRDPAKTSRAVITALGRELHFCNKKNSFPSK